MNNGNSAGKAQGIQQTKEKLLFLKMPQTGNWFVLTHPLPAASAMPCPECHPQALWEPHAAEVGFTTDSWYRSNTTVG